MTQQDINALMDRMSETQTSLAVFGERLTTAIDRFDKYERRVTCECIQPTQELRHGLALVKARQDECLERQRSWGNRLWNMFGPIGISLIGIGIVTYLAKAI